MKLSADVIEDTLMDNYFFLHHNTDIGQFDQNMRGIQYYGHDTDTFDVILYNYIFILVILLLSLFYYYIFSSVSKKQ